MTVKKLIEKLQQFDENLPIAIYEAHYDVFAVIDDLEMSVEDVNPESRPPVKNIEGEYKSGNYLLIN
jgi:hypothetical protein